MLLLNSGKVLQIMPPGRASSGNQEDFSAGHAFMGIASGATRGYDLYALPKGRPHLSGCTLRTPRSYTRRVMLIEVWPSRS